VILSPGSSLSARRFGTRDVLRQESGPEARRPVSEIPVSQEHRPPLCGGCV